MKKTLRFCIVLLPLWCGPAAWAAMDIYLRVDGIEGEATEAKHKGWIQVASFHHAVTQPATTQTGARSTGRATFTDLTVTKSIDKASVRLLQACARGERLKSAALSVCRADRTREEFYRVTLKEVAVTGVETAGDTASQARETLTLGFAAIAWTYRPASDTGKAQPEITAAWDLTANKAQ